MPIQNAAQMTGRGWTEQDNFPPGFFYGGGTNDPHLHVGLVTIGNSLNPPWQVNYIGFRHGSTTTVIYDRIQGIDNHAQIQHLPGNPPHHTAAQMQAEAQWAYGQR